MVLGGWRPSTRVAAGSRRRVGGEGKLCWRGCSASGRVADGDVVALAVAGKSFHALSVEIGQASSRLTPVGSRSCSPAV